MKYSEETLQAVCVRWFELAHSEYALLLHHSPNGGYRTPFEAKAFKRMGTRAGFPDLVLLVPRGGCPYLCIEMKSDKGKQTPTQRAYQEAVQRQGAQYAIARSVDEFISLIDKYLNQ